MSYSRWKVFWKTFKVFILFTGSTLLFYYGIVWINKEYEDYHRYEEPEGPAVKVVQQVHEEETDWVERLLLFYLDGE
ncbi:MAG TPA: YqzK family protein [Chondromyces sp.]|nr:YqzK family protein [Chondromyces sp.]